MAACPVVVCVNSEERAKCRCGLEFGPKRDSESRSSRAQSSSCSSPFIDSSNSCSFPQRNPHSAIEIEMATKSSPRINSLLQALLSIHHQQPRIIASPPIVPGTTSAAGGGGNPSPGASRRASVAISKLVSKPVGIARVPW